MTDFSTSPHAPYTRGSVPAAGWFCIETTFRHRCPNPEGMLRAHGVEPGADPLATAAAHGMDTELATEDTLRALAETYRSLDAGGRGLLLTRDHAGMNDAQDTRACGWIRALHAEGRRLWAYIELTPYGHAMVDAGEYTYFSTEYDYAEFTPGANGATPTRLRGCTLTNMPRHAAQVPCTNSRKTDSQDSARQGRATIPNSKSRQPRRSLGEDGYLVPSKSEDYGDNQPLSPAELAAFQSLAASTLTPAAITTAAATAAAALEQAVATNTEGEDEATAQNGCTKPNCPKHPRHDSGSGIHAHKGGKSTRGKSDIGKTGSPNLVETGDSPRKQKRALTKAFAKVKRGEKVSTGYKVGSHELVLIPGNKEHYGRDHAERSEHPKKIPADKLAETAMRGERTNDQRNDVTIEGKGHVLVLSPQKQPSMAPGEKMKPRKKHDRLIGKNWYNRDNKKSPRQERRPTDG